VPTSTKPQAEILELNKVNDCNEISFGDDSILEGDRIPLLKSHGHITHAEIEVTLSQNAAAVSHITCLQSQQQ